jgi:tetratricopeptide (TPR) repeat protein
MDMDWSWGAAEREFQRAITLDPNNAAAHQAYGEHLMAWGRLDEAIAELSRATDLDPFTWRTHYMLARTFSAASRYDEALQHWRESIALGCPTGYTLHRRMAIAYEGKGMEQEAVAELVAASKAFAKEQGTRRQQDLAALVAQKYLSSGYAEAKKAFLRGDSWGGPIWKAEDYAELGENDKAFEWLNKTIQMNNPNRKYIKVDDRLTALRADSSFQDLVRNLGFPP